MDFGQESGNHEAARKLVFDFRLAGFSKADEALCEFAEKLTREPDQMGSADVTRLRDCGFSDEQISVATQVVGYFNYINRIADALGVDLEPEMEAWVNEADWRHEKKR